MASIATDEDVVNLALSRIGAISVSDLANDTTAEAVQARAVYYNARDKLMRTHAWNFLTKRVELSEASSGGSAVEPVFGWDKAFTLPADFLRIISVHAANDNNDQPPYKLEKLDVGGTPTDVILINSSTCFLRYIYKEETPSRWITSFQDALAWDIAAELCLSLPVSVSKYDVLERKAEKALLYARSIDGIEDYPERMPAGSWVTERDDDEPWSVEA